jgi:hypothetical protein
MKTLEQMSDLEKRSLARWIRRKMQGRVSPDLLESLSDDVLLKQYFNDMDSKKKSAISNGAEDNTPAS